MFDRVRIDISGGICNARCAWCKTGINNRNGVRSWGNFITLEMFKRIIQYCKSNGFMKPTTHIDLYIWGEPFLHPQLRQIVAYLNEERLRFQISSNASRVILFAKGELENCVGIHFSMPGFSQESYDKVHMFDFEEIKHNIERMSDNFYNVAGLPEKHLYNIFHMYQYNLLEIPEAILFAANVGAVFRPYTASFAGPEGEAYLTHTLSRERLEKASRELLLTVYDKCKTSEPYKKCKLFNEITINERGEVMQCCAYPDSILGSLFDMKAEEVNRIKDESEKCIRCRALGLNGESILPMHQILPFINAKNSFPDAVKQNVSPLLEILFDAHILLRKVIIDNESRDQLLEGCQICADQIKRSICSVGSTSLLIKRLDRYCELLHEISQKDCIQDEAAKIQQNLDMEIMYIKYSLLE